MSTSGVHVSYSRTTPSGVVSDSQNTAAGSVTVHPLWAGNGSTSGHDIALVRLSTAWQGRPFLERAQLPFVGGAVGQAGTVASGMPAPGQLAVLQGSIVGSGCLLNANEICVRSATASVCSGDSGSGFITTSAGANVVTGIVSTTTDPSCSSFNEPFEATDVAGYLDWIKSVADVSPGPIAHHLVDRSAQFGVPAAGAPPSGFVVPGFGTHNIVYRDTSGHLRELWRDSHDVTGTTDLTSNAGAPTSTGRPFGYADQGASVQNVLSRDGSNDVHVLFWTLGAVSHFGLTGAVAAPKAASDPIGWVGRDGFQHVVYRTSTNQLHEVWWTTGGSVGHGDLSSQVAAPAAAGNPSAYVDAAGTNIVVFRSSNGHIRDMYWSTGALGLEDLSGFAGTPLAAGDPVAYYTAQNSTNQIVYRAGNGHLYELYWAGVNAVAGWDLTAVAGAPAATGTPAAYYSAGTNTKHVFYRSSDSRLHELWWVPGGTPSYIDLTAAYNAPPAADDPTAFTVEGPNTQHVAYRGTDGHIYELLW